MQLQYDITYELFRQIAIARFSRVALFYGFFFLVGNGVILFSLLENGFSVESHLTTVLMASVAFVAIFTFMAVKQLFMSRQAFEKSVASTVKIAFTEDTINIETVEGTVQYKWTHLLKVTKHKHFWLLFSNEISYSVLPLSVMTAEIKQFLERKLQENTIPTKWS